MATNRPTHLRIHVESNHAQNASEAQQVFDIQRLMNDFTEATGWQPRALLTDRHRKASATNVKINKPVPIRQRVNLVNISPVDGMLDAEDLLAIPMTSENSAWALLESIDAMVQRLRDVEEVLQKQEAQLTKQVGVSVRGDDPNGLSERLQESLHRAVEMTCSDAAAIYLLDDSTSELKMRACWGMDTGALAKPARNLRGSLADLEALMGNAVLLENTRVAPEWNCPEEYAAALCVPIGSPTMPHGTLWLWSDHIRDFQATDIESAKAAADKILSDIERSVLADEVLKTRKLSRQVEQASLLQSTRLPSNQALHDDYDLAGWTHQAAALGGHFHTWHYNTRGQICAAIGGAAVDGVAGSIVATCVQTVVEAFWNTVHRPIQVIRKANDLLWNAEDGDWRFSLCYLQLHADSGSLQLNLAGQLQAYLITNRGHRMVAGDAMQLGQQADANFTDSQIYLEAGEILVIASAGVTNPDKGGFQQEQFLKLMRDMYDDPASEIADHIAQQLANSSGSEQLDRSLLVLRRRF